jgi:hypothetical protein
MSGTHPQQKYARTSGMMETKESKDPLLHLQLQLYRAGVSLEMTSNILPTEKFPSFKSSRNFIITLTTARHWTLF